MSNGRFSGPYIRQSAGSLVGARLMSLAVLVAIALGGWYVYGRLQHSSPVSVSTAVARYRSRHSQAGTLPAPGVYTYTQSGSECGGVGPICLRRSLPSTAQMIVSGDGTTLTLELDVSKQHIEAWRYGVGPVGRRLEWRRTDLSLAGFAMDDRHDASPQTTLALPRHLRIGKHWHEHYRLGSLVVDGRFRVLRRETVDVAGAPVPALVVAGVTTTTGPHPGTEHLTIWHSSKLGIDLRIDESRRLTGAFPYRLDLHEVLASSTPQT